MAGRIKRMIDELIEKRARGNSVIESTTRTRLVLKGINPDRFDAQSDDDPGVIEQLQEIANNMGLKLGR